MNNKREFIVDAIIVICLVGILYSSYHVLMWFFDSKETQTIIDKINDDVTIEDITNNKGTIVDVGDDIANDSPYWSYVKMNLINVDISKLKLINSDTIGWLQVPGTNVNYPFLQTSDNDYYLTHSMDKSYNSAGWLFLDYRNNTNIQDRNNIIYAHGRYDETMFGSLKRTLNDTWLNNADNHIVKVSTESTNTLWQVFSIYKIPTTSDYIQTEFNSDDEYLELINTLKNRSIHDFGVNLSSNDKILTLSTCYNNDEKLVLHARLIKVQEK